ncbi:MAG: coenzyme F420-0:L-glutamate ligase [Rhodospirillales bacterium]|nr:coenzyme F420-0:L-glutamate ligase [Rhodospirillales bacterium]MSP79541.1 coenzyme F420-0:L-glutamate ligase [Rhodospirillales bacterium]
MPAVTLIPVPGLPLVRANDDLSQLIAAALEREGLGLEDGDIVAAAQKIVSKAEGRQVALATVAPGPRAREIAKTVGKDPRLVELILSESRAVVRTAPNVLIVEHRLGFVMANGGVDQSNVDAKGGEAALLLPLDPDGSAARLKVSLEVRYACRLGVVVTDSFGRPWRNGVVGVCLGAAGIPALRDRRGSPDLFGRALRVTEIAMGDEIAAAASLLMGAADEGIPVVIVRGFKLEGPDAPAAALIRDRALDLFR